MAFVMTSKLAEIVEPNLAAMVTSSTMVTRKVVEFSDSRCDSVGRSLFVIFNISRFASILGVLCGVILPDGLG
ncbi:unnamed protein product [Euphydryas editha]|uniref:Uncharacterized protein n=1 Tax=Euphydryas editha TaxID=104508 RepID=A0AAU9UQF4_EUPED|nr:unnamed protein product [Euphydryas editha]